MSGRSTAGVSFVVPVRNGAGCVRETLEAIFAQADGRPLEVIVVDDRSDDGSSALLARLAAIWPLPATRSSRSVESRQKAKPKSTPTGWR